jgi:hypothetical protein
VTPPAHIRLASTQSSADSTSDDSWQLDLPQDPVAAAEYLRGMERAREVELDAIRRLRQRIEDAGARRGARTKLIAVVAALVLATCGAAYGVRAYGAGDATPAPGHDHAAMAGMSHAEHAAMGSGLAVALTEAGPQANRTELAAGTTTLILRNELDAETTLDIEPADGTVAGTMTSATIQPGERVEWPVALTAGTYELCVLVDGEPVMGSTLTVS